LLTPPSNTLSQENIELIFEGKIEDLKFKSENFSNID